ncbi:MAG: TIGR03747 family integrating conjugative element membrane protein [bacterium]|nr:TIGR03747 family integrating conjugative element membrane protein [bacterium]
MAIKTNVQRRSNRVLMSLLFLIFIGWFILFVWALNLWAKSGFDAAWQSLYELSKQQTTAVTEFSDASIAEHLKSWAMMLPTEEITHKVATATNTIKNELHEVLPEDNFEFNGVAQDLFQISKQVWLLFSLITHVLCIKLMVLLASIPLFALAMTAGLIDGLNQRSIRTASLGRESSYVFHQLNRYFNRGLLVLLALWLATPISITPEFMFIPISILMSVMVSITASRFKKYV